MRYVPGFYVIDFEIHGADTREIILDYDPKFDVLNIGNVSKIPINGKEYYPTTLDFIYNPRYSVDVSNSFNNGKYI